MTTSSWDRSRRVSAATCVLTVITVVAATVVLVLGVGVPGAWWPHTGRAFAADARPAAGDPCGLIAGPGKAYCARDNASSASTGQQNLAGGAWPLVPAGAGVGALVVWRLRSASGRRRL
ncbi:hypothetical protein MBT84_47875 [Streptomyces sp. MBT84]|nr:hypothetical protein [Streptomyces sp. MBT84]